MHGSRLKYRGIPGRFYSPWVSRRHIFVAKAAARLETKPRSRSLNRVITVKPRKCLAVLTALKKAQMRYA
jgi:hypothetical protein